MLHDENEDPDKDDQAGSEEAPKGDPKGSADDKGGEPQQEEVDPEKDAEDYLAKLTEKANSAAQAPEQLKSLKRENAILKARLEKVSTAFVKARRGEPDAKNDVVSSNQEPAPKKQPNSLDPDELLKRSMGNQYRDNNLS